MSHFPIFSLVLPGYVSTGGGGLPRAFTCHKRDACSTSGGTRQKAKRKALVEANLSVRPSGGSFGCILFFQIHQWSHNSFMATPPTTHLHSRALFHLWISPTPPPPCPGAGSDRGSPRYPAVDPPNQPGSTIEIESRNSIFSASKKTASCVTSPIL